MTSFKLQVTNELKMLVNVSYFKNLGLSKLRVDSYIKGVSYIKRSKRSAAIGRVDRLNPLFSSLKQKTIGKTIEPF